MNKVKKLKQLQKEVEQESYEEWSEKYDKIISKLKLSRRQEKENDN